MTISEYLVLEGEVPVLAFRATPGPLFSTAPRPPGLEAPTHAFIAGQALDASAESRIGALLSVATSAEEFVVALRHAGFDVREERS